MAGYRRPLSASSVGSQLSSVSLRSYLSSSARSHQSSLEDIIVKEYLDKIEKPKAQCPVLPRNYTSPYAKTSARHRKDRKYNNIPKHGSASPPQSVRVARRSTSQDRSTHQKASAQYSNAGSDDDLNKSDIAGSPCLSSQSKRNRPVSAPQGHVRYSVKKFHMSPSGYRAVPVFKRLPWVIRATAYKNGDHGTPIKVSAPTIPLLLERCTEKLKLNMAARRIFLSDGNEAIEPKDIPRDADIYISSGESFIDPLKNVKETALLSGKMAWTMNGFLNFNTWNIAKTKLKISKHRESPSTRSTGRILVFLNGSGKYGHVISTTLVQMDEFLDLCTSKMDLGSTAKWIFDVNGEKVECLRNIPLLDKCLQNSLTYLRGPVWLSKGEGFSPTGVKVYIQGVLSALRQRLKSASSYSSQTKICLRSPLLRNRMLIQFCLHKALTIENGPAFKDLIDKCLEAVSKFLFSLAGSALQPSIALILQASMPNPNQEPSLTSSLGPLIPKPAYEFYIWHLGLPSLSKERRSLLVIVVIHTKSILDVWNYSGLKKPCIQWFWRCQMPSSPDPEGITTHSEGPGFQHTWNCVRCEEAIALQESKDQRNEWHDRCL
ncbi:doublecortin domain-containing protein 1-like [Rana temporaria]|uniref:doublecortin domain-containing protein 1-like n=1 Tax=Rana temporaria TaxID=8407 RepID=UPI001AAC8D72|nr:doublecortin domain-containing protein 1-like [Rana temporaria]